ncbi:hypothetical protein [Pseudoteredinibacter isoporae]|uniref:Uncharacterized protein n=1 Tax=Pseudoteredinibacter isoporae TaxID=570281 RepID=A0A7X0JWQ7_9GAMM|nr:hypothetical protein [Pseudoteredinibacter isoporae]MBB6523612.1 hypothetical protein [Pseudoteredinibacter isoporae]NHO89119.1 hypothetical protein [Pseudoteredinibacter isoporae]NIB22270.1 hypothetical protein [Pseudoteredinibacter isoporae]
MNIPAQDPELVELRQLIRSGSSPDSPYLIQKWLHTESCCINRRGMEPCQRCSKERQQNHFEQQFYLLLDTISDELIDPQWRCLCLDYIYRPLHTLHQLIENEQDRAHWLQLRHELSVCSHYVAAGLNQPR